MNQLSIGYFADGPWGHQALELLVRDPSIRVAFVCGRFDRPDLVLRDKAAAHQIVWFTHPKVNSDEFLEEIRKYRCDLFVSMSFNQIFRKRLMQYPKLKTINCHAGKLPFYRGRNILNWVLINDEKEFGITVHYVDEGIDTGDILAQRVYPITDGDSYATLLERAHGGCAELLYETVKKLQANQAVRLPQSEIHPLGSYCTSRTEGDERLNWNQLSRDVFNFVRAICRPGPEARTFCRGLEIRVNRVEYLPLAPSYKGIPGAVLGVDSCGFFVKTADSYVKVTESSGADRIRTGDRLT
jgi:methionyl-tRNA formyltransferase